MTRPIQTIRVVLWPPGSEIGGASLLLSAFFSCFLLQVFNPILSTHLFQVEQLRASCSCWWFVDGGFSAGGGGGGANRRQWYTKASLMPVHGVAAPRSGYTRRVRVQDRFHPASSFDLRHFIIHYICFRRSDARHIPVLNRRVVEISKPECQTLIGAHASASAYPTLFAVTVAHRISQFFCLHSTARSLNKRMKEPQGK
ncbi:hypothetical protein SCHPADRAFT_497301 [Schizopora paradoxa]|uniref:Uncharacterized protein n=1 Tax=Schizopora paradoxa TaxID=27342 RepID=A0A0H2RGD7_9AGAM|nr:hypothetical protein SCHPADRAFT_497301 [Schizopora paradoxa]